MIERTLLDSVSPITQSFDAVKQLIAYYNHGQEPGEMPPFYRLSGEMVLVLSNKRDSYYVVTPKTCSCPAATYRPGQCKHQRQYFPEPKKAAMPMLTKSLLEEMTEQGFEMSFKPGDEEDNPGVVGQTIAETLTQADQNLHRMPKAYQRMVRAAREDAEAEPLELISRGGFKPVLE